MLGALVAILFFVSNEILFFDNPRRFWVFIIVFSVLALAAAWKARSSVPAFVAFLLCVFGMLPWFPETYSQAHRPLVVSALTIFWALFLIFDLLRIRVAAQVANWSSLTLAVLNGFVFFGFTYSLLKDDYAGWMGLMAVGVATAHLFVGRLLLKPAGARSLVLIHIGIALTLVTLAIPIQLEQDWVTIGWGLEALVLVWIGFKTGATRMREAGLVVLGLCLIRLFAWTALQTVPDYTLVFNRRFLAFLAISAIIGLVALLYRKRPGAAVEWGLLTPLVLVAYTVLMIGASQEAWSYYDHQQAGLYLAVEREEIELADFHKLSTSITNRGQLVISLLWGVGSILAIVAGIIRRYRPIRLFGMGLFVLAIAKVFMVDIWALEQIYRIISTIALGSFLLGVAFLYQRFKGLVLSPTGQDCVAAAEETISTEPPREEKL